jgi:hypothetical protein
MLATSFGVDAIVAAIMNHGSIPLRSAMCRVLQEEPSDPRGSLGEGMYLCVALFPNVISYERGLGCMPEGQRVTSQNGQRIKGGHDIMIARGHGHGHGQPD